MTVVRSRRAGISAEEARQRPLYAKVLGLQYLRPSSLLCFVLFEGALAVSALLALAELVDWWAVAVLPASVAAMVKLNDVFAGAALKAASDRVPSVRGQASVPRLTRSAAPDARPPNDAPGQGFAPRLARGGASGAGPGSGQPSAESGHGPDAAPSSEPEIEPSPGSPPGSSSGFAVGFAVGAPDGPDAEDEWTGSPEQRARQAATRRYE